MKNLEKLLFGLALVLLATGCGAGSGIDSATSPSATDESEGAATDKAVAVELPIDWALAIHGGAGVIPKTMEEETKRGYFASLEKALELGRRHLQEGGSALDTVENVVRFLEDDPRFNAGKGAVYTHDGRHELDAAIMDGRDLSCGAVAAVTTVKNPISLARLVMEKSPHVFMMGEGAEAFGAEHQIDRVAQDYFHTERRYRQLQKVLEKEDGAKSLGTVGAVARDREGNLAAATSTGGLTAKRFGRVGDVPVIGAGTYANNATCAVSATGKGEEFIRNVVAHEISSLVRNGGLSLGDAARRVIHERLAPGDGGVIAVGPDGALALVFNSPGMFRGAADSAGRFEVKIWE